MAIYGLWIPGIYNKIPQVDCYLFYPPGSYLLQRNHSHGRKKNPLAEPSAPEEFKLHGQTIMEALNFVLFLEPLGV